MAEPHPSQALGEIEAAAERLATPQPGGQSEEALKQLARTVLEHHDHPYDSAATSELFSRELPMEIQRLAAVWLVRVLTKSARALDFENTERRAGILFDSVFQHNVYNDININPRTQTYQKLHALTDFLQSILEEAEELIQDDIDLRQINSLRGSLMRLFNRNAVRPFLSVLLSRSLMREDRISRLFKTIGDYAGNEDADPMDLYERACSACDEFESEARTYGTADADRILGGLARQMKAAVTNHFNSLEASQSPSLTFSPIAKKYPLERPNTNIVFKVKIANDGTGPARELRLDTVVSDDCLQIQTESIEIGTIQAGDSFVLDIKATVVTPSDSAQLIAQLSWASPGGRHKETPDFIVEAQRADVDWDSVGVTEPYSLEAVTTGSDLIGRKQELRRLLRLANSETVGSGIICGQKRVGKTSLANAVAENLESSTQENWLVISRTTGTYYSADAASMLQSLGDELFHDMRERIPGLEDVPSPDFKNGLAPLSRLVAQALRHNDIRILFILDEFDELPLEFLDRTPQSAALYLPLRQMSSQSGCGFLLVGSENMQQILNNHGDRLNKFTKVELDYFAKSSDWSDFSELIRKPVQDWLEISETALEKLFASSAGNPYFAKLLARQLNSDMSDNSYSYAGETDMEKAIDNALNLEVDTNSFAHFWLDGWIGAPDDIKRIQIIRRLVLIAAGRVLRRQPTADTEAILAEFKNMSFLPVGEQEFRNTLQDFIRRKVLIENRCGNIFPKIPLFRSWLTDKGVRELLGTIRELEHVRSRLQYEEEVRVADAEIRELEERLDQFSLRGRAIESPAIRKWLDQFDSAEDQRLMFRLLSEVRVYSERTVREKMHEAFEIVTRNIRTVITPNVRYRRDILVSSLDDSAAKSGPTYCRLFASENRIYSELVQPLDMLSQRGFRGNVQIQRLVIIDDFAGTGNTMVDGLRRKLKLLRNFNQRGVRIILIVVVGFAEARDRVGQFIGENNLDADVYFCDELGPEYKAFGDKSAIFAEPAEREKAKYLAEVKGIMLEKRHPLGFEDSQATVVFYQSCPNNTLPILWSRNNGWFPLFPRFPS